MSYPLPETGPRSPRAASVTEPGAVETRGLSRDYGGTGLYDVNLHVPRGSVYGLVGPNGAGKTTLLSILTGMRHCDGGTITHLPPRRAVGVCPDVPEFDGWLTAREVVGLAASLTEPGADPAWVSQALLATGLEGAADRRVRGFSRGMVQRLGLACAIVTRPALLILDEPTSALDPAGRADVLDLVAGLRGRSTVVFSSHILADVQRIADHVGILRDGRMLYQGPTRQLVDTYLRPSWSLRLGDDQVVTALRAFEKQPWVVHVEQSTDRTLRVDASSLESGERGIPSVLAAHGCRLVSCQPVAADLESAFLALTERAS